MHITTAARRRFQLILIKPSHYDDDGYVIRWYRAIIPSNSLAALYGIAADCAGRQVLGSDTAIDIEAIDETNTRVDIPKLLRRFRAHDGFGMVALVGVQSNQYPRALDIARPFREAGIEVAIGGFHVSGCLSMLDGHAVGLDECRAMGVSIFAGEAENHFDTVLQDAASRGLQSVYNVLKTIPAMAGTPAPFLPKQYVARTLGLSASFDAGRGCPYQCSFCTIINVQGRKSRYRSPDDIEHLVRLNWAQGICKFFITDDNFSRNEQWESIFDRLISLRAEGIPLGLMIQVDTLCHKIPNFIEKAHRAGVTRVFIGLENINPDNLAGAKKRQNKITEYRAMLLAWKSCGIMTLAGYILGFPADTPASIRRDVAIIQKELPIDVLEFFCLTPLPGSEDHQSLWRAGIDMEPDLNIYDVEHVCTAHPKMTKRQWEEIYRDAWSLYYSPEHMRTLLRRAAATRVPLNSLLKVLVMFATSVQIENVHPLQAGVLRLKHPSERRHGLARENALIFWGKFAWETISKHARLVGVIGRLVRMRLAIGWDRDALRYSDLALTPVSEDEAETHELLTQTTAARAAVAHVRKISELTGGGRVAARR
ncbi:MAG: radical SAM protein [Rhizobiales bacterium]|nr:radical SAM protein [Hyphomicrobiales bacterium]